MQSIRRFGSQAGPSQRVRTARSLYPNPAGISVVIGKIPIVIWVRVSGNQIKLFASSKPIESPAASHISPMCTCCNLFCQIQYFFRSGFLYQPFHSPDLFCSQFRKISFSFFPQTIIYPGRAGLAVTSRILRFAHLIFSFESLLGKIL